MKASERIGLLMYRFMRNDLNAKEKRELLVWRNKSPKHETAFQEATDWENVKGDLQWSAGSRHAVMEKIKEKYPALWQLPKLKPIPKISFKSRLFRAAIWTVVLYYFIDYRYQVYEHQTPHPGNFSGTLGDSPDEIAIPIIHDMIRGFAAGKSGLKLVEHDNGEKEYFATNRPNHPDRIFDEYTFRSNSFVLRLPGMGSIWVNASTTIWYPAKFLGDTLRIKLTGEAYFEMNANKTVVVEIPSTPAPQNAGVNHLPSTFITEAGSFNVHAYPFEPLKVGRDEQSTAWKNRMIYYRDASLKTILDEISRWYNVDVEYIGSIPDEKFSIRLPRNAEFSEVVRVLKAQGAKMFVNKKHISVL